MWFLPCLFYGRGVVPLPLAPDDCRPAPPARALPPLLAARLAVAPPPAGAAAGAAALTEALWLSFLRLCILRSAFCRSCMIFLLLLE